MNTLSPQRVSSRDRKTRFHNYQKLKEKGQRTVCKKNTEYGLSALIKTQALLSQLDLHFLGLTWTGHGHGHLRACGPHQKTDDPKIVVNDNAV